MDFNITVEQGTIIKFNVNLWKIPNNVEEDLTIYGESPLSWSAIHKWFCRYNNNNFGISPVFLASCHLALPCKEASRPHKQMAATRVLGQWSTRQFSGHQSYLHALQPDPSEHHYRLMFPIDKPTLIIIFIVLDL